MRRRNVLRFLGGAAVTFPLAARGQHTNQIRQIGMLMAYAENDREGQAFVTEFRAGLNKLGWAEGRSVRIITRWAISGALRQRFAKELVALNPELIISLGTPCTTALAKQTHTIPIVFVNVTDPIGGGFVESFSRPGGNITGFTHYEPTLASKWLQLLKEIAPRTAKVAFLFNPTTAPYFNYYIAPFKAAAPSLGVEAVVTPVRDRAEFGPIIAALAHKANGGLIVMPDVFMASHRKEIITLATRYHLPAVYPLPLFTAQGGLLSYGSDTRDQYKRAAGYANRILKGEKPGNLPVQLPVKFMLTINLKAAKARGLTVPPSMIIRADEVIE
jgi:putative ABC transport system substrate-binding protein